MNYKWVLLMGGKNQGWKFKASAFCIVGIKKIGRVY